MNSIVKNVDVAVDYTGAAQKSWFGHMFQPIGMSAPTSFLHNTVAHLLSSSPSVPVEKKGIFAGNNDLPVILLNDCREFKSSSTKNDTQGIGHTGHSLETLLRNALDEVEASNVQLRSFEKIITELDQTKKQLLQSEKERKDQEEELMELRKEVESEKQNNQMLQLSLRESEIKAEEKFRIAMKQEREDLEMEMDDFTRRFAEDADAIIETREGLRRSVIKKLHSEEVEELRKELLVEKEKNQMLQFSLYESEKRTADTIQAVQDAKEEMRLVMKQETKNIEKEMENFTKKFIQDADAIIQAREEEIEKSLELISTNLKELQRMKEVYMQLQVEDITHSDTLSDTTRLDELLPVFEVEPCLTPVSDCGPTIDYINIENLNNEWSHCLDGAAFYMMENISHRKPINVWEYKPFM